MKHRVSSKETDMLVLRTIGMLISFTLPHLSPFGANKFLSVGLKIIQKIELRHRAIQNSIFNPQFFQICFHYGGVIFAC